MALTDEERKELEGLEKKELIDMVGNLRDQTAEVRAKAKQETIDKFLNGSTRQETEEVDEGIDILDLEENKAFQRLKKKFNNK